MRNSARFPVLLAILVVVACDDNNGGVLIPVQNQATVRFVNAIPGTSNLGFTFNGVSQGGTLAFQGSTQCLRLNTSASSFAFNTSGTTGVNRTFTQTLVAGSRYTILAAGTASNPSVIALTDESVTAASGRARVRVINATSSADTGRGAGHDGRYLPGFRGGQLQLKSG